MKAGRWAAWALFTGGVLLAVWGAVSLSGHGPSLALSLPPPFGRWTLQLDALGAGAALLGGILFAASGLGRAGGVGAGGAGTALLLLALLASVAWFLASSAPLALLLGWEAISAASYLVLVRDRYRVRRAAWALLALTEVGTGLLFFALLWSAAPWRGALAFLALGAFGAKAGLFPLQVWVPLAEPEAAGDVAGLFSGLLTAVAVVGFLRVVHAAGPPPAVVGGATAVFGLLGALGGAVLGLVERDAKRVLAYGTLETVGLGFAALGVGMLLAGAGAGSAAEMAVAGGLVLLAAHGGAKFAAFSFAGYVEERAGLRSLDRMGGLGTAARRGAVPVTVAMCALAGLPPFGVFLGEWLLIEACYVPLPTHPGLHIALAVLAALVGVVAAAALTVYLRWTGTALLGRPRTQAAAGVEDMAPLPAAGQWLAASVSVAAGVGAGWVLPWVGGATAWLAHGQPLIAETYRHPRAYAAIEPLGAGLFRGIAGSTGNVIFAAGGFNVGSPWDLACFAVVLGLAAALATGRLRRRPVRAVRTWVGGEPEDSPRLDWTAEALPHPLRLTFAGALGLRRARVRGALGAVRYRSRVVPRLERYFYVPLLRLAARASAAVRHGVQSGDAMWYVAYLLLTALAGLAVVAGKN